MKSLSILITTVTFYLISSMYSYAQQTTDQIKDQQFTEAKETIIQDEREALKVEVEEINNRLQNGSISKTEADTLKNKAAEKHAKNIENRLIILKNTLELADRNGDQEKESKTGIYVGWDEDANDFVIKTSVKRKKEKKEVYDFRTKTGVYLTWGLLDLVDDDNSYGNTDVSVGRSTSFEVGISQTTRVFKKSNFLRIKYGLGFEWNKLTPRDNTYLVDNNGINTMEQFPSELRKSEVRFTNIVIPVYFELGPSKKIESQNYIRFSTQKQFKIGFGGYGGLNIETMQKLKYREDGRKVKQKIKRDYNTTDFVYGVGAYVGYGSFSLFAKYELSPLFENQPIDKNLLSLGFRLDFD
ncbi:hypothetical protein EI546_07680 [Aequorivita sp. H23M31]|uniref:PorT family protein n=1 Tax=Aequorivita ciconiae TaxID=2494375 RepID=A0A410G2Z8_9FLAO|nr:hypothetical protein [Aequorivita sp. H23M31]QAA81611.1 hypothetical protein EI546_07680 [Aequorivita sp. H23M31]